jgi:hypothetical protein
MKSSEPSTKVDPSVRKVNGLPRGARRDRHELAFLPAALEIVETPPSPLGRTIAMTISREDRDQGSAAVTRGAPRWSSTPIMEVQILKNMEQ